MGLGASAASFSAAAQSTPRVTVFAWGANSSGELATSFPYGGVNGPIETSGLEGAKAVAAGFFGGVALLADGTVRAWGSNNAGQLGDGSGAAYSVLPVTVSGLSGVTAIASGAEHNLALLADGSVMGWGENGYGQLGEGTAVSRFAPVPVSGLAGVTAIAAGDRHSLAVLSDGTVEAWGANESGQLGNGTTVGSALPQPVPGINNAVAVSAGYADSFALLADGTVVGWGDNRVGELGNGTTVGSSDVPVPVSGLQGVLSIAAGGAHTLALLANGTVASWGSNQRGQLGDGTTVNKGTPVAVSGLSHVVAVTAGEEVFGSDHSAALLADGTVMTWGEGGAGELGNGTNRYSATPVAVAGLTGVTAIAAGGEDTFAVGPMRPGAATGGVSAITPTSATISATINPNEEAVGACVFEYGTSASYGSSVPCSPAPGSGGAAVPVAGSLTGLSAGTAYHFRITASNPYGTSYGADASFTTASPPEVDTGNAASETSSSASLTGTVRTHWGVVSECYFEYSGPDAFNMHGYSASVPCESKPEPGEGSSPVSATVGGLQGNSSYHFRLVVRTQYGVDHGWDNYFWTAPNMPSAVTSTANVKSPTTAELAGTVNPNDSQANECYFQYGETEAYGSTVACASVQGLDGGSSPVAVSSVTSGLSVKTEYHYRLVAVSGGLIDYGADETFVTLPGEPTAVTGAAGPLAAHEATLNATVDPNGGLVSSCTFEYGQRYVDGPFYYRYHVPCASLPGAGEVPVIVSARIANLPEQTWYHYRVVAVNVGGESIGEGQEFRTPPDVPAVTTGAATNILQRSATLTGEANPHGTHPTRCVIEYGTTTTYDHAGNCVRSVDYYNQMTSVEYAATGLEPNTTYHFRVLVESPIGVSYGHDTTFTTPPDPPEIATGAVSAIGQHNATLNLTVTPNASIAASDCFGYYETTRYDTEYLQCGPALSGTSPVPVSIPITGLSANTTYHFGIWVRNAAGIAEGGDHTFTTLPEAPSVVTGSAGGVSQVAATLNANVNPNGGSVGGGGCVLEYGISLSYGQQVECGSLPLSGSVPVAVSGAVSGLSANTTYHFRVSATNAGGTSHGADHTFRTLPEAPSVVTGSAGGVSQVAATLNANVNPNGGSVGGGGCVLEYGISLSYGQQVECGSLPLSGSVPVAVSGAVSGLSANTTYHFRVSATNAGGTSHGPDQTFTTLPKPPVVSTITPAAGTTLGGTAVTIHGTGFTTDATVTIGTAAIAIQVLSATEIKASTPASAAGPQTVIVSQSSGTSSVGPLFTYVAPPRFFECIKQVHGSFTDSKCKKPVAKGFGKYELREGIGHGKPLKGTGGQAVFYTPAISGEITCAASALSGTLSSPSTETHILGKFTGCTAAGQPCTSAKAKSGEIRTNPLVGVLGYIDREARTVGLDLQAEAGRPIDEFSCAGQLAKVEGSVIGQLTGDIDNVSKTSSLSFAVTEQDVQAITSLEGSQPDVLLSTVPGVGTFESAERASMELSGEALEVHA